MEEFQTISTKRKNRSSDRSTGKQNMSGYLDDTIISYGSPLITRYECKNVYDRNKDALENFHLEYAYEMIFDCTVDASEGITFIQGTLLHRAKKEYLTDGTECVQPRPFWFAAIDSSPDDVPAASRECQTLVTDVTPLPANQCCVVVQGNMTFVELARVPNATALWEWSRKQFISDENTASNGSAAVHMWGDNEFTTQYIGIDAGFSIQTGSDELNPASNDGELPQAEEEDKDVTGLGVVMILFMLLCMGAVAAFVWIRRKRDGRMIDFGIAVSKSEDPEDLDLKEHDQYDRQQRKTKEESEWIEPRRLPGAEPRGVPSVTPPETERASKVPYRDHLQEIWDEDDGGDEFPVRSRPVSAAESSRKNARKLRNDDFDFEQGVTIIPAHPSEFSNGRKHSMM